MEMVLISPLALFLGLRISRNQTFDKWATGSYTRQENFTVKTLMESFVIIGENTLHIQFFC